MRLLSEAKNLARYRAFTGFTPQVAGSGGTELQVVCQSTRAGDAPRQRLLCDRHRAHQAICSPR
jgi:hypothetical protein